MTQKDEIGQVFIVWRGVQPIKFQLSKIYFESHCYNSFALLYASSMASIQADLTLPSSSAA